MQLAAPSDLVRRILWSITATCLVGGVLAAAVQAGGDEGGDGIVAGGPPSTTTTAVPGLDGAAPLTTEALATTVTTSAPSRPAAAGATTTTARTGGPTTTAASPAAPTPKALARPQPGTYQYRWTRDGKTNNASVSVADAGPGEGGAHKLKITATGQGGSYQDDVTWGRDEIRVLKTTYYAGPSSGECDWSPDHLQGLVDLRQGATWSSETSCSLTGFGAPIPLSRSVSAKVVEAKRVNAANADLVVWVIEATERYTTGDKSQEMTHTTWLSPEHGLVVRQTTTTKDAPSTELELVSLEPV